MDEKKMVLIGYEKRISKSGNVGYVLYITMPVSEKHGLGAKLLTVYSFGRSSAPYVDEGFFNEKGISSMLGKRVSLTFNQFGNIDTISL